MEGYFTYFSFEVMYNRTKEINRHKQGCNNFGKKMLLIGAKGRKMLMNIQTNNMRSNKKNPPELISADSYIKIYGFMRSSMNLEKTELLVYALVYSYFRNSTPFTASREYIAEWVGSGKSSVDRALTSLLEKGYITKVQRRQRGYSFIEYNINVASLPQSSAHYNILKLYEEDKRKCRNM